MIIGIIIGILLLAYLLALIFELDIFTSIGYLITVGWFVGFRLFLLYFVYEGINALFRNGIFEGLILIIVGGYCFYLSVREIDWGAIWKR
jgi:hypothetical protein